MLPAGLILYWLPKHGINGWTAEPRDKYLELMRDAEPTTTMNRLVWVIRVICGPGVK